MYRKRPDMVDAWWESKRNYFWHCPECDTAHSSWELDWSHTNAFAGTRSKSRVSITEKRFLPRASRGPGQMCEYTLELFLLPTVALTCSA